MLFYEKRKECFLYIYLSSVLEDARALHKDRQRQTGVSAASLAVGKEINKEEKVEVSIGKKCYYHTCWTDFLSKYEKNG